MKKIMLKRSILNIRMLFVIVVNFAILFVSLFEYGIITADGKTPGSTYDILPFLHLLYLQGYFRGCHMRLVI